MPDEPWDVKVFRRHREDDPNESCPAEQFLGQCPQRATVPSTTVLTRLATCVTRPTVTSYHEAKVRWEARTNRQHAHAVS